MIKTKILLWKTIEDNGTLRVRVKFPLFYSELTSTDPWSNMLRDFTWTENIWGGNVRWTPSICAYSCAYFFYFKKKRGHIPFFYFLPYISSSHDLWKNNLQFNPSNNCYYGREGWMPQILFLEKESDRCTKIKQLDKAVIVNAFQQT